ncbi:SRPBCC family protein [Nakamurella flavida]|uniref:SRPBCC family protein n=1 Tax=Nakamurella flavida TaxID=363630 RepID=A0A938YLG9_9ACTN|nr:SRPBCC family protein [Nakamurella flavida]MBM9476726.1 SRPBCC family protein [Nakamurella flavida]MDP9778836.1 uncharacterized protein YndB with AHSA1/START domain [Nakamurella flavida]
MTAPETLPALHGTATVALPADRAFALFTGSMARWWPASHHIGESEMADLVIEPRVGGRWYEVGTDGAECDWGHVLVWEPPGRLVLTWQIDGRWTYDPDRASEVEIRFTQDAPEQTTVTLEHRLLERLTDGRSLSDEISAGDGGWNGVLARFAGWTAGRADAADRTPAAG